MPVLINHAEQLPRRHRSLDTLDVHQLRLAQHGGALDQSGGGLTEHHRLRRGHRLHPLRQPDLLTNRGVTQRARSDFARHDLPGIEAHPKLQHDTVAPIDLAGKALGLILNAQCGQTRPQRVVLQSGRGTEYRHDPVTGELVDRAAISLHHHRRAVDQLGHDLAQPLGTERRRDVHRMHHVGKQHRHLLVLGVGTGGGDGRATSVAEPGVFEGLGTTRAARQYGRHRRLRRS